MEEAERPIDPVREAKTHIRIALKELEQAEECLKRFGDDGLDVRVPANLLRDTLKREIFTKRR